MMKKTLLTLLVLIGATATASAYDFIDDGFAYNINEDGTSVTITYVSKSTYYSSFDEETGTWIEGYTPANPNVSGALIIPSSATNNGVTYTVTGINQYAFKACDITSVTIPASVTAIHFNPFEYCYGLEQITVDENNPNYDSRNNCNAIITKVDVTVPIYGEYMSNGETVSYIYNRLSPKNEVVVGCKNSVIPDDVTSIGEHSFYRCYGLTSIVIPEGATSIGNSAFVGCKDLQTVTLPSTITSFGLSSFHSCMSMKDVYAYFNPANVTMGNNAVWEETVLPVADEKPAVNLHLYPEYAGWYEQLADETVWKPHGYHFNVLYDLGVELYLIGSFNGWNYSTKVPFTSGNDGKWTITQAMEAGATFKLVDQDGKWIGCSGTPVTQEQVENEEEIDLLWGYGSNFTIPVAGTWTLKVDIMNRKIVISGEWKEPEPEPTEVYILGEVNGNNWAANAGVQMATEDHVTYTADVNCAPTSDTDDDGYSYFSFTTMLDESNNWDAIAPYRFGAVSEGDFSVTEELLGQEISLTYENGQALKIADGEYILNLNLETMKLVITKKAADLKVGDVTGDGNVDIADVNAVINIILGKATVADYPGNANISGDDDTIDIADVNAIINIILGKTPAE